MQAKDIPERPILEWLAAVAFGDYGRKWASAYDVSIADELSIMNAMPAGTPEKVARAKMAALIRRGLVEGCACGCRGDYMISPDGELALIVMRSAN